MAHVWAWWSPECPNMLCNMLLRAIWVNFRTFEDANAFQSKELQHSMNYWHVRWISRTYHKYLAPRESGIRIVLAHKKVRKFPMGNIGQNNYSLRKRTSRRITHKISRHPASAIPGNARLSGRRRIWGFHLPRMLHLSTLDVKLRCFGKK